MTEEARKSTGNGDEKKGAVGVKTKVKYSDNILPIARIRKIMKMDPQITDGISAEANYAVCTATEMFVRWLSKKVFDMDTKCLSYKNLAKFVQEDDKLDFLHQIIPNKITVREYKKILAEIADTEKNMDSGSDVSSSEDEEEEQEEEEQTEGSVQEISDSEEDGEAEKKK